jgi:hypothetical protein
VPEGAARLEVEVRGSERFALLDLPRHVSEYEDSEEHVKEMKANPNARSSMKMKTQIIMPPGGCSGLLKSVCVAARFTGRPLTSRGLSRR